MAAIDRDQATGLEGFSDSIEIPVRICGFTADCSAAEHLGFPAVLNPILPAGLPPQHPGRLRRHLLLASLGAVTWWWMGGGHTSPPSGSEGAVTRMEPCRAALPDQQ